MNTATCSNYSFVHRGGFVQSLILQEMSTSGMKWVKQPCGAWSRNTKRSSMIKRMVSWETNTWTKSLVSCVSLSFACDTNSCGSWWPLLTLFVLCVSLFSSVPILKRVITQRQVDNKIHRIERRFKNRNDNRQKSGAGNLSQWSLEERVGATIGDCPTVHVETVSSLRKDNSKGQLCLLFFRKGEGQFHVWLDKITRFDSSQLLVLQHRPWQKEQVEETSLFHLHRKAMAPCHAKEVELTRWLTSWKCLWVLECTWSDSCKSICAIFVLH